MRPQVKASINILNSLPKEITNEVSARTALELYRYWSNRVKDLFGKGRYVEKDHDILSFHYFIVSKSCHGYNRQDIARLSKSWPE